MNEKEEKLYKVLADVNLWRIPPYPVLMREVGYKSKNGLYKALRQLHKKGFVDVEFKPFIKVS